MRYNDESNKTAMILKEENCISDTKLLLIYAFLSEQTVVCVCQHDRGKVHARSSSSGWEDLCSWGMPP